MLYKISAFVVRRFNAFFLRLIVLSRGGFIPLNCIIDVPSLSNIYIGRNVRIGLLVVSLFTPTQNCILVRM